MVEEGHRKGGHRAAPEKENACKVGLGSYFFRCVCGHKHRTKVFTLFVADLISRKLRPSGGHKGSRGGDTTVCSR